MRAKQPLTPGPSPTRGEGRKSGDAALLVFLRPARVGRCGADGRKSGDAALLVFLRSPLVGEGPGVRGFFARNALRRMCLRLV